MVTLICQLLRLIPPSSLFFFFNDTATTEIYTLSLHDALPIFRRAAVDLNHVPESVVDQARATGRASRPAFVNRCHLAEFVPGVGVRPVVGHVAVGVVRATGTGVVVGGVGIRVCWTPTYESGGRLAEIVVLVIAKSLVPNRPTGAAGVVQQPVPVVIAHARAG